MPLAVGNTWYGKATIYDTSFNKLNEVSDTLEIVKDSIVNGDHWFVDKYRKNLYRNTNNYLINRDLTTSGKNDAYFSYPTIVGGITPYDTIFRDNNQTGGVDTVYYMMIVSSTDTLITVPAGSFHCYCYQNYAKLKDGTPTTDPQIPDQAIWYSPGTGLIKMYSKTTFLWLTTIMTWELTGKELH
jgi:hypothetical protein